MHRSISANMSLIAAMTLSLIACATLPDNSGKPDSFAFTDTENTRLGREYAKQEADHAGRSGFLLLGNGLDAFVARAVLSEVAERSIDAQYYLYHDDLAGRLFTLFLLRAADRGEIRC